MRRWFGFSLAVLLLIIAYLIRQNATSIAIVLSVVALVIMMVYYSMPATQLLIIRSWQFVTFPITWLMSHLLLGSVFFVILLPMAVIAGLLGYDPLRLKRSGQSTNWIARNEQRDISRYFKQF
jgi:hypothetical protein